jgi:hypothetical protein
MPIPAPTVFLSSRFDEFAGLRARIKELLRDQPALPCHVIDLAEDYPDTNPPLTLSQNTARTSDIMVLLVGQSYGTVPAGQNRSYVHLEYEAACSRHSNTIVLPYIFDYRKPQRDERVEALCDEIRKRHKASTRLVPDDPDVAFHIVQDIQRNAFALNSAGGTQNGEADFWIIADGEAGDEEIVDQVEQDRRIEDDPHLRLNGDFTHWKQSDLIANPARIAAAEQKREALQALSLGEWRLAIWHLHRALQHRPWDLTALFWSARLRFISGRRDDLRRAMRMSLRAARVAEREIQSSSNIPLAACYLLAARAAAQLEEGQLGVDYALRAHDAAGPHFWLTHFELARQHANVGEAAKAMDSLQSAFYLRPMVIRAALHEPAFRRCSKELSQLREKITAVTRREVRDVLSHEQTLWSRLGELRAQIKPEFCLPDSQGIESVSTAAAIELDGLGERELFSLVDRAKKSFQRQLDSLTKLAAQAVALASKEPTGPANVAKIEKSLEATSQQIETQLQNTRGLAWDGQFTADGEIQMITIAAAIFALVTGLLLFNVGHTRAAVLSLVLAIGVGLIGSFIARHRGRERARNTFEAGQSLKIKEFENAWLEARSTHARELSSITADIQRLEKATRAAVTYLVEGVNGFEATCLKRRIYCPTPALHQPPLGAIVRLSPEDHAGQYEFDDEILPTSLIKWYSGETSSTPRHRLYRLLKGSTEKLASRRACYFEQNLLK